METLNNEARKYVNWLAQLFLIRKIKKVCRLMTTGRVLFMNEIETVHISGSDVLHTVRSVNYSVSNQKPNENSSFVLQIIVKKNSDNFQEYKR